MSTGNISRTGRPTSLGQRRRSPVHEGDRGDEGLDNGEWKFGAATLEPELYAFFARRVTRQFFPSRRTSRCARVSRRVSNFLLTVNRLTNDTLKKLVSCLYYQSYMLLDDSTRGLLHVFLEVTSIRTTDERSTEIPVDILLASPLPPFIGKLYREGRRLDDVSRALTMQTARWRRDPNRQL